MARDRFTMMDQYRGIKRQYSDCILFFRLGDFYEMFYEDAELASRVLGLALTSRDKDDSTPMCGVPHHSSEGYISQLVSQGYKVAVCDQLEEAVPGKLVKRDVVRIVTAGTITDEEALKNGANNYIACVFENADGSALAWTDVTTGEFFLAEYDSGEASSLLDELARIGPREILINKDCERAEEIRLILGFNPQVAPGYLYEYQNAYDRLCMQFGVGSLHGLGMENNPLGVRCAGALLDHLSTTIKYVLGHIHKIQRIGRTSFMQIDANTRRNLELVQNTRERTKKHSLLWVLDKCQTAMGSRVMRKWIEQPLVQVDDIEKRHEAVEELREATMERRELRLHLASVHDFERLLNKLASRQISPVEVLRMKASFELLPSIKGLLEDLDSRLLKEMCENFDSLENIHDIIQGRINPGVANGSTDIIRAGVHQELDSYKAARDAGEDLMLALEARLREETGIKKLRIRHNRVFGRYIEVTNSHLGLVPDSFTRRQTLANAERYTTPDLKQLEDKILSADEAIVALEVRIFTKVLEELNLHIQRIQYAAAMVASIDVLVSLAEVADRNSYTRPKMLNTGQIIITNGRHPVVERLSTAQFIANDTVLDGFDCNIAIITGPNMAGKSTYMRQVALIVLMAQIGSLVPAEAAEISPVDKLFTRVGASDDLAQGRSTFMVEMSEVANILNNATANSLVILDELGRGTSTFDGLSIAWSVIEHISANIMAKTLVATHYHELVELEYVLDGVQNYHVQVSEVGNEIVFRHKIARGGSDKSYGIQVAKIAGVPDPVLERAKDIMKWIGNDENAGLPIIDNETTDKPYAKRRKNTGPFGAGYFLEEFGDVESLTLEQMKGIIARVRDHLSGQG